MPTLYSKKKYIKNGTYHVFNRGVEKRKIFIDSQDHSTFINILKQSLLPKQEVIEDLIAKKAKIETIVYRSAAKSYHNQISLLSFVLMPNHFHFLIQQSDKTTMPSFMKSIQVRYSLYFNRKYNRVGSLFQSRYRGVLVRDQSQLIVVSRYIHRNPLKLFKGRKSLRSYSRSSYSMYIGGRKFKWVDTEPILKIFDTKSTDSARQKYRKFVESD